MPSVWLESRRNKNGRSWVVRWEVVLDGKRDRGSMVVGPSKALAEKTKEKKIDELFHRKAGIQLPPEIIGWKDFASQYLRHCEKHKSLRTFRNFDKPALDRFTAFAGEKSLSAITTEDVGNWESRLLETYSPNTVRMNIRCLRTAFLYAKKEGLLIRAPSFHMPQAEKVGRSFTDQELKRLLSVLPKNLKAPVIFTLFTGVRRGELLSLDWKMVRKAEEGHWEAEIGGIGGYTTKTRRARVIPLHPKAVEIIGKPKESGPVFPGLNENNLTHGIKRYAGKANMGRVRLHDLRHTWATRFMQSTGDIFALMALGGWTSLNSVAIYQHITKGREQALMAMNYGALPNISPKI